MPCHSKLHLFLCPLKNTWGVCMWSEQATRGCWRFSFVWSAVHGADATVTLSLSWSLCFVKWLVGPQSTNKWKVGGSCYVMQHNFPTFLPLACNIIRTSISSFKLLIFFKIQEFYLYYTLSYNSLFQVKDIAKILFGHRFGNNRI